MIEHVQDKGEPVFLRKEGRVLRVTRVRPNRLGPIAWGAAGVPELSAGTIERTGARAGDNLEVADGDATAER
jgi:uncharacterized membrane protein (UPF0127 family)